MLLYKFPPGCKGIWNCIWNGGKRGAGDEKGKVLALGAAGSPMGNSYGVWLDEGVDEVSAYG